MKEFQIKIFKNFILGIAFMFGALTMGLLAVTISGTIKTWKSGDRLTSTDLNTTIASLKSAIEGIPVGTYCGQTASSYTGNIGGYATAKSLCATACGNSNAHMCSGHEIFMTQQNGITIPTVSWYGSGMRTSVNGTNITSDCDNFTSAGAAIYGHFTNSTLSPDVDSCAITHKVACCL